MNKQFVFITGPSESGKSGAAEYMERRSHDIKHLKMRDIIRVANSRVDDDTEQFWKEYINVAVQMSEEKSIIIMDTLRKPESALILSKLLNERMSILYIEASLKNRVIREYRKLKEEGKDFTMEDIMQRTKDKDIEKEKAGLIGLRNIIKGKDGKLKLEGDGEKFSYIINNDGNIDELHKKLDEFILEINKEEIER